MANGDNTVALLDMWRFQDELAAKRQKQIESGDTLNAGSGLRTMQALDAARNRELHSTGLTAQDERLLQEHGALGSGYFKEDRVRDSLQNKWWMPDALVNPLSSFLTTLGNSQFARQSVNFAYGALDTVIPALTNVPALTFGGLGTLYDTLLNREILPSKTLKGLSRGLYGLDAFYKNLSQNIQNLTNGRQKTLTDDIFHGAGTSTAYFGLGYFLRGLALARGFSGPVANALGFIGENLGEALTEAGNAASDAYASDKNRFTDAQIAGLYSLIANAPVDMIQGSLEGLLSAGLDKFFMPNVLSRGARIFRDYVVEGIKQQGNELFQEPRQQAVEQAVNKTFKSGDMSIGNFLGNLGNEASHIFASHTDENGNVIPSYFNQVFLPTAGSTLLTHSLLFPFGLEARINNYRGYQAKRELNRALDAYDPTQPSPSRAADEQRFNAVYSEAKQQYEKAQSTIDRIFRDYSNEDFDSNPDLLQELQKAYNERDEAKDFMDRAWTRDYKDISTNPPPSEDFDLYPDRNNPNPDSTPNVTAAVKPDNSNDNSNTPPPPSAAPTIADTQQNDFSDVQDEPDEWLDSALNEHDDNSETHSQSANNSNDDSIVGNFTFNTRSNSHSFNVSANETKLTGNVSDDRLIRMRGQRSLSIKTKNGRTIATFFSNTGQFSFDNDFKRKHSARWLSYLQFDFSRKINEFLNAAGWLDSNGNISPDGNEGFRSRWNDRFNREGAVGRNAFYSDDVQQEDFDDPVNSSLFPNQSLNSTVSDSVPASPSPKRKSSKRDKLKGAIGGVSAMVNHALGLNDDGTESYNQSANDYNQGHFNVYSGEKKREFTVKRGEYSEAYPEHQKYVGAFLEVFDENGNSVARYSPYTGKLQMADNSKELMHQVKAALQNGMGRFLTNTGFIDENTGRIKNDGNDDYRHQYITRADTTPKGAAVHPNHFKKSEPVKDTRSWFRKSVDSVSESVAYRRVKHDIKKKIQALFDEVFKSAESKNAIPIHMLPDESAEYYATIYAARLRAAAHVSSMTINDLYKIWNLKFSFELQDEIKNRGYIDIKHARIDEDTKELLPAEMLIKLYGHIKEVGSQKVLVFDGDPSTLLHEGAHMFLDDLKDIMKLPNIPDEMRQQWLTLTQWLGVADIDLTIDKSQWTQDQRDRWDYAQEKFASAAEQYFLTGKAPESWLKRTFKMFKRWMLRIYDSVKNIKFVASKDGSNLDGLPHEVELSPEIKGFFDSLFKDTHFVPNEENRKARFEIAGRTTQNDEHFQSANDYSRSYAEALKHIRRSNDSFISPDDIERFDQLAYHGTGHILLGNKFDLKYIGTGDTRQLFGWGIYFSHEPDYAANYRQEGLPPKERNLESITLKNGKIFKPDYNNQNNSWHNIDNPYLRELFDFISTFADSSDSSSQLLNYLHGFIHQNLTETRRNPALSEHLKRWSEMAELFKSIDNISLHDTSVQKGNIYIADIPENDFLLDWGLPLDAQLTPVKKAVRKIIATLSKNNPNIRNILGNSRDGADFYRNLQEALRPLVEKEKIKTKKHGTITRPDMAASLILNQSGIFGNKFVDEGVQNFVIWNTDLIQITGIDESSDEDAKHYFNAHRDNSSESFNQPFLNAARDIHHAPFLRADESSPISQKQYDMVKRKFQGTDMWLKAPNGKKSNLNERQWIQVRTPNFKHWFGDWERNPQNASKILDENGEPLVVYHGTLKSKRFSVFNTSPIGIHFGTRESALDRIAYSTGYNSRNDALFNPKSNSRIIPCFLNIKNPAFSEDSKNWKQVIKMAEDEGHDGIIYTNEVEDKGSYSFIVFTPEQTKSATRNNGNFNPADGDFYKQHSLGKQDSIRDLLDIMHTELGIKNSGNVWVDYARVSPDEAERLSKATGLDINDRYVHTVIGSSVTHTLNRHGVGHEQRQDQLPITDEDFERIPDIINNPDEIKRGIERVTGGNNDTIVYKKRINGHVLIVEEVRNRRGKLMFHTMRKSKAGYTYDLSHKDHPIIKENSASEGVTSDNEATPEVQLPNARSVNSLTANDRNSNTQNNENFNQFIGTQGVDRLEKGLSSALGSMKSLNEAKLLDSKFFPPSFIWRSTGWIKGKDGQWRTEIQDGKIFSEFFNNHKRRTVQLQHVYDNDFLYAAYPELKSMPVRVIKLKDAVAAGYDTVNKIIVINQNYIQDKKYNTVLLSLIHEIQHAIQDTEGFANGGDLSKKGYSLLTRIGKIIHSQNDDTQDKLIIAYNSLANGDNKTSDEAVESMSDDEKIIWNKILALREKLVPEFDAYQKQAGEVEARNTETRAEWDIQKRKAIVPTRSEDVKRSQQLLSPDFNPKSVQRTINIFKSMLNRADPHNINLNNLHKSNHGFLSDQALEAFNQPVYTGTGNIILNNKFDLRYIGSNEGSTYYGWGAYFAENIKVSERYRKYRDSWRDLDVHVSMTDGSVYDLIQHDDFNDRRNNAHDTLWSKNNESHPKTSLERNLKHVFVDLILQWKAKPYATFSELKNNLRERYEKRLNGYNDTFNNELLNYLNQVQNFEARKRNGNLYTFDIPENDVLLDWDKPLSQQPEHVKKALEKILSMEQFNDDENGLEIYDNSSGADLYEQITSFFIAQNEGYDFDDNEDGKRWRRDKTYQKKTSMLLNKFGIPGLRFFDGQSRAKQEGTHNFVIWNEDAIKLLSISDDSNLDAIEYFNNYKAEHQDGFINSQAIEKLDQLVQHSTCNIILNNKFDLRYVGSNAGLGLYGHGAYFEGNIQRDEYYRYFGWVEPPKEIRITSLKDGTVYSNSPDAPEGYGFSDLYDNVDGAAPVLDMLDMDIYDGKVFNTEHYLKMLRLSLGADAEIEGEYNTYHKHNKHSQHSSEEDAYEPASNIGKALKFLDNYKIEFPGFKSRNGNTYIFDIPEDFELLDWNAPLSQQPEQVKHHINEIINELRKRGHSNNDILGVPEHIKMGVSGEGEFVLKNINPNDITGGVLYENISNILGYEGASQIFNQFGIPGHRHWDDNSWKEQKGHHNYLIWNMDKIRMVDITEDSDQEAIDYFNKYRDEHHESYNQNVRNTDDFYLTPEAKKQIQRVREKFEGTESWLRAPNGKKSNLNEAQWLIVRTPNFKRWFGDWEFHPENASKVLDENGEPLVVYHGTLKGGFSVFNTQGLGRTKGTGAWFTDSRQNVEFDSLDSLDVKTLFSEELRFAHSAIQSLKKDGYISSDKIYEGYSKGLFSKDEADHINKRFLDSQNFIRLQSEIFSVINSLDDSIINLNNFNGLSISDEAYYGHSKEKINEAISVLEKLIRDEINSRNRYQIYDTFLNIRNPYIFDANGNEWNDLNGNHDNFTTDKLALQVWGNNPEAFDGIFILNVRDGAKINNKKIIANDYIIPYDTQVKSANRNNGSFSEISDIYKQSERDNYSSGLEADSHNSINNADFINHINNLKQKARNTTPKVIDFDNPNFSSIVNDDDIEQFEQRMFHGTGHIIFGNHFDLKYLGSGEGTCYRGWGIYLGEAYGIGQFYRKFGTPGPILTMKDGSQFRYDDLIKNKANLTYGTDRSYALSLLKGIVKGKSKTIDDLRAYADMKDDEDLLNFIDNIAEIWKTDKKGNIYEIEGPENDVLLDLDASLDNQPAHVKKAINKIKAALKHNPQLNGIDLNAIPDTQDGSTVSLYDAETGLDFYFSISKAVLAHSLIEQGIPLDIEKMSKAQYNLEKKLWTEAKKTASLFFNQFGVPGLRFWDKASREAQKGTHNFVIWDTDTLKFVDIDPSSDNEAIEYFNKTRDEKINSDTDHKPSSDEDEANAMLKSNVDSLNSLNSNINNENSDSYNQIIGIGGAKHLDEEEGVTWRMDNLKIARKMERAKSDSKAIWAATGWIRGKDGQWRIEIPDGKIIRRNLNELRRTSAELQVFDDIFDNDPNYVLSSDEQARYDALVAYDTELHNVFDAPQLYKAYPDIRNISTDIGDLGDNALAAYDPIFDMITINKNVQDLRELRITLIHELQHAIQVREGFAVGFGYNIKNDSQFKKAQRKFERALSKLDKPSTDRVLEALNAEFIQNDSVKASSMVAQLNPDELNAYNIAREPASIIKSRSDTLFSRYKRHAGETEARNSEKRAYWNEARRKRTPLDMSEDVPRNEQIIGKILPKKSQSANPESFNQSTLIVRDKSGNIVHDTEADENLSEAIDWIRDYRHDNPDTPIHDIIENIKWDAEGSSPYGTPEFLDAFRDYSFSIGDETYDNIIHGINTDGQTAEIDTPQKQLDKIRKQYEGTSQWLKAPNGKHTNLTEKQWLQVRTPNFKKWFGDWEKHPEHASKVLDSNGEPLVVWHGSPYEFSVFDTKGEGFSHDTGAWFTSKERNAASYGSYVYPTFLNIRNPYVIEGNGRRWNELGDIWIEDSKTGEEFWTDDNGQPFLSKSDAEDYILNKVQDGTFVVDDDARPYSSGDPYDINSFLFDRFYVRDDDLFSHTNDIVRGVFSGEIAAENHDGVIFKAIYDTAYGKDILSDVFVVRSQFNVKSATNNNGNFDSNNQDIYHQKAQIPNDIQNEIDELLELNRQAEPEFIKLMSELQSDLGGELITRKQLKSPERIYLKALRAFGGDVSKVGDVLAATLLFDNEDEILDAIINFRKRNDIVHQANRWSKPKRSTGYRDFEAHLRLPNGVVVELQLQLKDMQEVKDGIGHSLYEFMTNNDKYGELHDTIWKAGDLSKRLYAAAVDGSFKALSSDDKERITSLGRELAETDNPREAERILHSLNDIIDNTLPNDSMHNENSTRTQKQASSIPLDPIAAQYLYETPDSVIIPLDKLIQSKQVDERSVARARKNMNDALNGIINKRKPLTARDNRDGTFYLIDGNDTFAALKELGAKNAPVTFIGGNSRSTSKNQSSNESYNQAASHDDSNHNNFITPELIERFNQPMWHGTRHILLGNKFDLRFLNSGEGGQAYGYGIYLGQAKEVGENYRMAGVNKDSNAFFFAALNVFRNMPREFTKYISREDFARRADDAFSRISNSTTLRNNLDEAVNFFLKFLHIPDSAEEACRALLKDFVPIPEKGNLYFVDGPEDFELLDWDAPMSQQPHQVLDKLKRAGLYLNDKETGEQLYRRLQNQFGGNKFGDKIRNKEAARKASMTLNNAGIPGHRFWDAFSREDKSGTHNFVIWNTDTLSLLGISEDSDKDAQDYYRAEDYSNAYLDSLDNDSDIRDYSDVDYRYDMEHIDDLANAHSDALDNMPDLEAYSQAHIFSPKQLELFNQLAYTGTGNIILGNKFDLKFIGSNEGGAMFGYGAYLSEIIDVAEHYRRYGSHYLDETPLNLRITLNDGRTFSFKDVDFNPEYPFIRKVMFDLIQYFNEHPYSTPNQALDDIRYGYQAIISRRKNRTQDKDFVRRTQEQLDVLNSIKDIQTGIKYGNIYLFDIPENDELLDWDAPLDKQPEKVKEAIRKIFNALHGLGYSDSKIYSLAEKKGIINTGEDLYKTVKIVMRDWLKSHNHPHDGITRADARASMLFNRFGIPGHRYFNSFSRENKKGTHNFVIWDTSRMIMQGLTQDSDKKAIDYFNNYKAHHKDGFISKHDIERFDQLVTHATGHIILDNKFDLKYSGSGEGGAMFGHGIYFEQSPEVAEHYRRYGLPNQGLGSVRIHSDDGFTYSSDKSYDWIRSDGKKVDDQNIKITLNSYLSVLAYHPDSTHNDIVKQLSQYLRNDLRHFKQKQAAGSGLPFNNFEGAIHDLQQQLDFLLSLKGFDPITPLKGNVYIADIPEDYDLLDWDETLDNQPDSVYERLLKTISIINKTPDKLLALHWAAKSDNHEDTFNFIYPLIEKLYHSGATFTPDDKQKINELLHDKYAADKIEADVRRISKSSFHINNKKATGEKIYKTLVNLFDSKEDASHWLNSQGIPGLRYWDQLSRDKKSGTHNFVIWDMNRISLLGLEGDNQAVDYFRDTALQKLTRNPNEHYRHNEYHHTENETYNQIIAEMGAMTDEDKYEGADYRLEDNYTFHNFKTYSQKLSFSQDNSFISPAVLEVFNQIRTHATGNIIYNNKFDLRYRGSSEGSAAFGAGAYFEESPEVAETYRHFGIPNFGLGTISVRNDDESVLSFNSREEWADLHDEDIKAVLNDLSYGAWKYHSSDKSKLIQQYSDALNEALDKLRTSKTEKAKRNTEERINTLTKKLDILQNKISFYPKNGNIYDFDIPDDPELMDWDKTIDKQSELVKPILLNIIDEVNHNPAPLIAHRLARDFKHPETMKKKLTPILQALFENIKAFVAEKNHDMDYYSADDIINEFKSIHEFKQLNRIVHSELTREAVLGLYDIIRNPIKPSCTGEELYKCITDLFYMGGLKDYFKNSDFAKVSASDFFNSKGIPGHRFLDRGSRHKGKGTHNYVIWNMSKIKMVSIHPDSDIDAIDYFNKFNQYREAFGDPHEFLTPDMLNEALSKLHDGEREHDLPRQSNEVYHQAIQRKDFDIVSEKQLDEVKKKFKGSPIWLKAPNGRPTNLTERQWLQVRTPNFKKWFGDWEFDPDNSSKVLDINGEPLVVYHGSKHAGFSVFDTSYGVWFSDSRDTSDSYINAVYDSDFDNNTYSVFLNIRNPLVIDYYGKGSLDYGNEPPAYWLDHSNGYDGVICRNIKDRGGYLGGYAEQDEDGNFYEFYDDSVYGVKSPEQIKSANDNNGNFDPHDTDIYLQPANLNDNPFVSRADYPFYNQDTEKAFSDSRNGIQRDRNSKGLKHALLTALRGFKGDYPELAGAEAKAKGLTYAREILRMLNRKSDAQTTMAVHSLTRSLDKLNKKQFEIFTRLLLINDIFNFKRKNPNAPLPLGFTNEALQSEGQRFLKLAKSDHDIWEAVNSEHKLNNQIKNQLSALALDLGLKKLADRIKHNHFDSAMIDYANIISRNSPYINGNYIQAMGELRIQQLQDIQRLQAVKDIRDNYDIKHKLIKQFGSLWGLHIPNGYKSWNILARNFIESANSLHENILSSALELTAQQLGLSDETLKSIRESMTESDKSHILVLPVEIVNSINSILEPKHRGPIAQFFKFLTTQWKKLMLFFPTRAAKYNIRNITGDLDAVLAANPKALRFMKQAMSELYTAFYGDDKDIAPELLEFQKRGGALTAQSAQELYDYRKMKEFKHLVSKIDDMNPESWKSMPKKFWEMTDHLLWSGIQKASNYREGWLRYACYLEFLSQMQNDKDGMPDNWGVSDPEEVMSIPDIRDRAFKMSNELIGAYDQVSETGRALRDLFIPFYSWMEINATRYLQLLKNGFTLDNPNDFIANIIKSTGIKSPIYAYRIGKTLLMVNLLALLVKAFNHLVWPDDEDKLPPDVKERPHITLGHDPITGEILYFDRIGALTDNLEWFAGDSFASDIKDILDGKISVTDWVLKVCAAPLNKIFQGITPLIKTPFELASGKSLYPDFTNPRNINDRLKYIAQSFGLAWPYKAITGEPRSDWHEFKNLFLYSSDADEAAYFYTLGLVRQFRENVLGKRSGGFSMTKRSLALQNLKKALRFNDKKAVERSLNEYYSLGGNNKGIKTSMRNMNPLHSLSKVEQQQFLTWISYDDKKYLERANAYFQNIIHRLYNH